MKSWWQALFVCMLLAGVDARAAITCTSVGSGGASINYLNNTLAVVQAQFSVTCTRGSNSDPASIRYSVRSDDNGTSPLGINNRATHASGAKLRYDLYTTSGCTSQWKGHVPISDTISWGPTGTGAITQQTSFWVCITNPQVAGGAGLYSDSVRLALDWGNTNPVVYGTVPVSIYAPASCTVVTAPGNLSLAYAAFGPQVTQGTDFVVNCTVGMPYTMTTDVGEAVLSGVRYLLTLNANASNGTGAPQTHRISATIPAGQAGACASCTGTRLHSLTITY